MVRIDEKLRENIEKRVKSTENWSKIKKYVKIYLNYMEKIVENHQKYDEDLEKKIDLKMMKIDQKKYKNFEKWTTAALILYSS